MSPLPDLVLRPAAIVFDLDGVLVDSDASVVDAWTRWAVARDLDPVAVIDVCHGQPSRATVRVFVEPSDEAAALADIDRIELDLAGEARALPGARALLASLPPGAWGVFTSGTRALATARLAACGIAPPPVFITADDVANGKPNPDGYRLALARLGAAPASSVVIEDAPNGIAAARAAAIATVIGIGPRALGAPVDAVVDDLGAVAWDAGRLRVTGDARLA